MGSLAEALTKAEQEQALLADPAVAESVTPSVAEIGDNAPQTGPEAADPAAETPTTNPPPDGGPEPAVADAPVDDSSDELAAVITDIEAQLSEGSLDEGEGAAEDRPVGASPAAAHDTEPSAPSEPGDDAGAACPDAAESAPRDTFVEADEDDVSSPKAEAAPPETEAVSSEPVCEPLPDAETLIAVPTYHGPVADTAAEPAPIAPPPQPPVAAVDTTAASTGADEPAAEPAWELVRDQELTEQYRSIRRQLMARLPRDRALVVALVGVAEPMGRDATRALNSVAALNLGSVIAEIKGTTAVVVDADFTGHGVTDLLRLQNAPGLADVVRGDECIERVIQPELVGHVDIIPAGEPNGQGPSELLGSDRTGMAFSTLRDRYDVVLVDAASCPAPSLIDHFPSLFTGVLLVTETGSADRKRAKALVARLEEHGVSVIGCILATEDDA